jgi:hypothetical protein
MFSEFGVWPPGLAAASSLPGAHASFLNQLERLARLGWSRPTRPLRRRPDRLRGSSSAWGKRRRMAAPAQPRPWFCHGAIRKAANYGGESAPRQWPPPWTPLRHCDRASPAPQETRWAWPAPAGQVAHRPAAAAEAEDDQQPQYRQADPQQVSAPARRHSSNWNESRRAATRPSRSGAPRAVPAS